MKTATEQPWAKYEIEHFELHVGRVEVEARSIGEAIARFIDGQGAMYAGSEYLGPCEEKGISLKSHPELAEQLQDFGVELDSIIPAVRTIRKLPEDCDSA